MLQPCGAARWLIEVISPDSAAFMQSCSSSDCVQSVGKSTLSFFFSHSDTDEALISVLCILWLSYIRIAHSS